MEPESESESELKMEMELKLAWNGKAKPGMASSASGKRHSIKRLKILQTGKRERV